ncbi:MAG: hypothetical protein LPK45_03655, partial [Bacteroidota bacterium]|nr:hypothetical protein [Bacteroidota bacterium]MDX5430147.1 hypothetical protein [Bacteroidota bacterium]MDX5468908.1 hypothetical protein [Bacteroidota bacterium]
MGLGIFSFLFFFTPSRLAAQISEGDSLAYQLKIAGTGFLQTGNVRFFSLRTKLEGGLKLGKSFYVKSQNNYLHQRFNGVKADDDIGSNNFLYYKAENRVYPYLLSFVSTNY